MSNIARKLQRQGLAKRRKEDRAYYGICDWVEEFTDPEKGKIRIPCQLEATSEHVCLTCEQLLEAGKPAKGPDGQAFRHKVCLVHRGMALEAVRKHALVAHPVNLLKMVVAAVKGDV